MVQFVLNTFLPRILGESVMLMSKNAIEVAYLKKQGGTISRVMCSLAQEIMPWTELHLVTLSARYVLWENIILSDWLSHPDQVLPTEWSFFSWMFSAIC